MQLIDVTTAINYTLRASTPLILAAMAGLFSERSGIANIALEGKMLGAAFAAATVAVFTGSWVLAILAAIAMSLLLSFIHGLASITYGGDQIVSGVAINMIMIGLTVVLTNRFFHHGGLTPVAPKAARFLPITLPGAQSVKDIPVLGTLYTDIISGHSILTYIALLSVPCVWLFLYKTRFGLRLRAVGENPQAVDTAGISVATMRYLSLALCSVFIALAGVYLSLGGSSARFVHDMSAGKGYIALAALIFGKWRPVQAMLACLLFGFCTALADLLQGTPGIPITLIQALPYILTVILLAGFIGTARPPKAIGTPYVKER